MQGGDGGGRFGRWSADADGHPWFHVRPQVEPPSELADATAPLVVPKDGVAGCWHSVSNAGITSLAHAGGWLTIYATARGMTRLTGRRSSWGIERDGAPAPRGARDATFGLGRAEWTDRYGPTQVRRSVAAPISGEPLLRIEVTVDHAVPGDRYVEHWVAEPRALVLGGLMSSFEPPPPGYGVREQVAWRGLYGLAAVGRAVTNAYRLAIAPVLLLPVQVDAAHTAVVFPARRRVEDVPADTPAWFDRALPDLFVAALDPAQIDVDGRGDGARLTWAPEDPEAGPSRFTLVVGLARDAEHLGRMVELAAHPEPFSPRAWGGFARLDGTGDAALERETQWHGAALVAAEQYDAHFGARYIAQGSAYGFIHGLQGAPRDYALYAVPMAYIDAAAAREQLVVMMRMTRPSGTTYYAHTGRGQCTSGGLHAAPTDLPIFFLWSLTEYVWATGDAAFLDQPVPFYPARGGQVATPRERAVLALDYIEQRVGRGPHGLLRVGSGDWSDPISAMVADRKAFHETGESGFNTAFAVYALPRVARLLAADDPEVAQRAQALADELRTAMQDTWTGEWFLRGWDGRGAPIGEHHLFLDGQVWALIAGVGTDEQRATLVASIESRCDLPSPIGATILDRPHDVRLGMLAPGWDCNGGVWATINALLAWGYAVHDPARARRILHKQSLAAHADAYPDIWYGIWSGPDAYNAHFGSRPGETFVQPATPMREFPVMNANAHAGPLLALLRVLGIEAEPEGVVVRERARELGDWTLSTPAGTYSPSGLQRPLTS